MKRADRDEVHGRREDETCQRPHEPTASGKLASMIDRIDRQSDRPAYKQLADQLRAQIESGDLQPGALLPPESELVRMTSLNRTTVRAALKLLRSQGLVDVQRGRGTFVRAHRLIRRYPLDGLRTEHALIGQPMPPPYGDLWSVQTGTTANVEVIREYERTEATSEVLEAFNVPEDSGLEVLRRRYLFVIDGRPHQLVWSYLRWSAVNGTSATDPDNERPDRGTMAQLHDLGIEVTSADVTARTRMPTPEEVRQLDIAEGAPVFAMRRIMYAGSAPVEFGESIVPGDRVELAFHVDFSGSI